MGTRSLTRVMDNDQIVAVIYIQFDGYPSGVGKDIKNILGSRKLVNGYQDAKAEVNGMRCAAAMLVAGLKNDSAGGVYLYPVDAEDVGEEYEYKLWTDGGEIAFGESRQIQIECKESGGHLIYSGPLSEWDIPE